MTVSVAQEVIITDSNIIEIPSYRIPTKFENFVKNGYDYIFSILFFFGFIGLIILFSFKLI